MFVQTINGSIYQTSIVALYRNEFEETMIKYTDSDGNIMS